MTRVRSARRSTINATLLVLFATGAGWLEAQQAASPTGTVELVVIVSADEPADGPLRRVTVSLQHSPVASVRTAMTDDEGRAVFSDLPTGNYTVAAHRVGYVRTFYGARALGRGHGVPLAVTDREPMPPVRLRMLRGGAIGGTVLSAFGAPMSDQTVQLIAVRTVEGVRRAVRDEASFTGAFSDDSTVTTDERGAYRFQDLAPGQYLVSVPLLGGASQAVQIVSAEELRWADAVVAGLRTRTPPPSSPAPPPIRRYAPVYYPGVDDPAAARVIELRPAEERNGVDVVMQLVPTVRVSGRVFDDQGRPQANVAISIRHIQPDPFSRSARSGLQSGRTAQDGRFTIEDVRPGAYTLSARATLRDGTNTGGTGGALSTEMLALVGTGSAGVTHWAEQAIAVGGQDVAGLTLMLQPTMVVTGRLVYDASRRAPPADSFGAQVMLVPIPESDLPHGQAQLTMSRGAIRGRVAKTGEFVVTGVPPGRYRVDVGSGLAETAEPFAVAAGGWLLKSVTLDGRDVADVPIEIRPGQDVSGVVLTFTDRAAVFAGTVFDGAGRPVSQYPIIVFSTNRSHWLPASRRVQRIQPASNGAFETGGLPAGEYFVVAVTAVDDSELYDVVFLDQLIPSAVRIALGDGERKVQDLKLGGGSQPPISFNPNAFSTARVPAARARPDPPAPYLMISKGIAGSAPIGTRRREG